MKDKTSRYNIEVEHENEVLVFNALTNRILPVGYGDYAIVETLLDHLPVFHDKYPDLYNQFKKAGFIVDDDFDEYAYVRSQNLQRTQGNDGHYRITVNPTLDCNLRCWYCSLGYHGAVVNQDRMSGETLGFLKKHLERLMLDPNTRTVLLEWFGGEPTLYFDEIINPVSEFAVRFANEHKVGFRQKITTNGTLLNEERIKRMKGWEFKYFVMTLDGNECRHNLIKKLPDSARGAYGIVIDNVNMIADRLPDAQLTLRINYDKQTLKNIDDIRADLGDESKKIVTIDFQRIWQVKLTEQEEVALSLAKQRFIDAGFQVTGNYTNSTLSFVRCPADKRNTYTVNFNGKVFKCTSRDYSPELVMGQLASSGEIEWDDGMIAKYYDHTTFENGRCENCKILPFCMGPCIQTNYDARTHNAPVGCLFEDIDAAISKYVVHEAKKLNLI